MEKLLVFTDLHLTPEGEHIIGLAPAARFQTTFEHGLTHHPDAKAVILMGDLSHHGDATSYTRLRDILASCPLPATMMLGNHDRRDVFLDIFPQTQQDAEGFVQSVIDLPNHRLIFLDTLDGPPYPAGHHAGRLCPARFSWLDDALNKADGRLPVVFSHHPPMSTGIIGMDQIKLAEGDALLSRLKRHDAYLLFGHMHRNFAGSQNGVPFTCFKSPCHQGPLDLETNDSSLSIDEPAGYGVVLLPKGGVVAHMQDVGLDQDVQRDAASV